METFLVGLVWMLIVGVVVLLVFRLGYLQGRHITRIQAYYLIGDLKMEGLNSQGLYHLYLIRAAMLTRLKETWND